MEIMVIHHWILMTPSSRREKNKFELPQSHVLMQQMIVLELDWVVD